MRSAGDGDEATSAGGNSAKAVLRALVSVGLWTAGKKERLDIWTEATDALDRGEDLSDNAIRALCKYVTGGVGGGGASFLHRSVYVLRSLLLQVAPVRPLPFYGWRVSAPGPPLRLRPAAEGRPGGGAGAGAGHPRPPGQMALPGAFRRQR